MLLQMLTSPSACICDKANGVSSSEKVLKVSLLLACILLFPPSYPPPPFFFFPFFSCMFSAKTETETRKGIKTAPNWHSIIIGSFCKCVFKVLVCVPFTKKIY